MRYFKAALRMCLSSTFPVFPSVCAVQVMSCFLFLWLRRRISQKMRATADLCMVSSDPTESPRGL
jgi:hypothetical protein